MSVQLVMIATLVAVFLIATVLPVHMGALAFVAAFAVGTLVLGESSDDIVGGFPGDLFVILVGVTYLFAIATNNGTITWLVHQAVRVVRGRIALVPWMMFLVTGALTAVGAVVPAAVAIIAPIGMGFALRYRINPALMGLFIINGASAGGFSPMSIFGGIVNGVVTRNNLPGNPVLLFVSSFAFNVALSVVVFFLFGGRKLLARGREPVAELAAVGGRTEGDGPAPATGGTDSTDAEPDDSAKLTLDRALTLAGLLGLTIGVLFFDLDVGFTAISVAVLLSLVSPKSAKGAVSQVAWPTVLLICGIVTFVSMMERAGTITFLGDQVAGIGVPLLAAAIICLIGAAVSAFASTTGILGALIPLAVPFLLAGEVGAVGLIIALSISSSVVDSSPFSTSGALVVANATEETREEVFGKLMRWGFSMVLLAPAVSWLVFVVL
ncbi:SLC13 family permease [Amycolatopsis magusensis]|uniref:Di/tricarboxylate transporter n=1 Tax=Amycolatopsis magusensis TaxID=882444 RepID=A0ABS4PWM6_9PSEU|nr:SLC13 family permease [Amycolatopsis magusensis]MBP2183305.1 di/tricarboxylate transporter [Amycolatopsis magusensis]